MNIANEVTLEKGMTTNDREGPTTVHEIEEIRIIEETIDAEILRDKIFRRIEKTATAGKNPAQTMRRTAENNPLTEIPLATGALRQT